MTDTVRWGIVGTGKIARAMAAALLHTPGALLAAVASRSTQSARAFADEYGAPVAFDSYQALADAPGIDVVYIATPHPMHFENAMLLLQGGKAVLCEKAFTMNRRQAEQIIALAREKKLFVMEAMWTRFMPALAEVRRVIASGELGEVRHLTADFGFTAPTDPGHRVNDPALGGGALLDLGIYPVSIAAVLLGPVQSVVAQAEMSEAGVDVQTAFSMRHAGGGLSVCSCSFKVRSPCELTVSGELGFVRMNTQFHRATSVTVSTAQGSRTIQTPYLGNGYVHEVMEVQRCLQAGLIESPGMTHDETIALMGVLDDIRGQIGLKYAADA